MRSKLLRGFASSLILCHLVALPEAAAGSPHRGGVVVVHHADGRLVQSPAAQRLAPHIQTFYTGSSAWEPTLGLTKRGEIFYMGFQPSSALGSLDFWTSRVIRSRNGARTWTDVSPSVLDQNSHPWSNDPYLYVDRDTGRVFAMDMPHESVCSLSFSDDLGKSWTTNPVACGDHPMLFSGVPVTSPTVGYRKIVYYCWNEVIQTSCGKSLDGGLTFLRTAPLPLPFGGLNCEGTSGHGVAGRDGTIYVPKVHRPLGCDSSGEPWLAISTDEGTTWKAVRPSRLTGRNHEAGIAVDRNGWLYFVWVDDYRSPYLSVSKNHGRTWSKPLMIAPPGVLFTALPGIDVGAPGRIAIVYMGIANGSRAWNGYMTMSVNATAKDPIFFTGTVNDPRDPLESGCGIDRCDSTGDFFDVVVGPEGTPWSAFVDGCRGSCVKNPKAQWPGEGIVGRMVGGPRLN